MATLYSQAESNVRKTFILIFLFLLFIIGLGWIFSYVFNSVSILVIAVILSIVMSFASYWYSDKIVLAAMRAKPVKKEEYPELYRLVENLCIAAGMPMPRIYVIPEAQPNAFATGRDEKHAVIAVTEGLLQRLERVELEGVLAHELSHIRNKDILIGTVAVILAGAVALASDLFLRSLIWGGTSIQRRDRDGAGSLFLILGLVSVILAPIAATLIKLAISRKREFLADASAALLTRYPEGLARALEKIAADETPMRRASNSTAHLFISSPFKGKQRSSWFTKLFMTHPPTEERIKALRGMDV